MPNVFSFTIAIGPDDEKSGIFGLRLQILGYAFLVLQTRQAAITNHIGKGAPTSCTVVTTGAWNSDSGGGKLQFLYSLVNSSPVRWPVTHVMVTSHGPKPWPKLNLNE